MDTDDDNGAVKDWGGGESRGGRMGGKGDICNIFNNKDNLKKKKEGGKFFNQPREEFRVKSFS